MKLNTEVSDVKTLDRGASQRPQVQMKRSRASHKVPRTCFLSFWQRLSVTGSFSAGWVR
jgi:hypothetical protein